MTTHLPAATNSSSTVAGPEAVPATDVGIMLRLVIFGAAMLLWAVPVTKVAYDRWGVDGIWSGLSALAVCLTGVALGVIGSSRFTGLQATNGVLFGILCRMGAAMSAGAAAIALGWTAGFMECLLANYLFSLVVDTALAVRASKNPVRR